MEWVPLRLVRLCDQPEGSIFWEEEEVDHIEDDGGASNEE